MDSGHWLAGAAARNPDRAALEVAGEALSYRELRGRALRAAGALQARGARRGTPVALALAPGIPFVEALHGCLVLGAPALPVDPRLSARERDPLLRAAAIVVERPLSEQPHVLEPPGPPADADIALIVHTSGTMGRPTPVRLSFGNIRANARGLGQALGLGADERWLCPLPLSHVGGLMVLLRSLLGATTAVLTPPPFDERLVAGLLRDAGITVASLVPTQLRRLLDVGARPGAELRRVLLGGGPMPRALLERAAAAGFPVCPSYGLTQACSTVTVADPGELEGAGRALPGVGVAIAPDGEILVSGPTVSGSGSLRTGDLGGLDGAGRLVVRGRKAELIITGGENVAPAEVEAVLAEHPGVLEAAVFARPHPLWGEAICALVVPRPGVVVEPESLRAHCAERLAGFKVPKELTLVDALPRTESGKLRRAGLGGQPPSVVDDSVARVAT